MDILHALIGGIFVALEPINLGLAIIGVVVGLFVGAMPGLGSVNGVAILLPFTFVIQNFILFLFPKILYGNISYQVLKENEGIIEEIKSSIAKKVTPSANFENLDITLNPYLATLPFVKKGFQVFMIDYSGFGFSQGKSKRKYVLTDSKDGLDYLLSRNDIKYDKLIMYGQSLGGHLAAVSGTQNQDKIDGLVLEGAFSSHKDAANDRVPFLSRLFVREMYSAEKNIKHYKKPLLIIHSTEDTTIPYRHGERLLELANEPKELYTIDGRHVYGPLLYGDSIAQKLVELVQ